MGQCKARVTIEKLNVLCGIVAVTETNNLFCLCCLIESHLNSRLSLINCEMAELKTSIVPLNGKNYSTWKIQCRITLGKIICGA